MIKNILVSVLILVCFALFQSAVLSNIIFLPAVPDFLLLCVVYFSVNNGRLFGISTGFASGLIMDFLSASPVGLHCLMRTVLGYVSGLFNKTININGFFLPAFLAFCSTVLKIVTLFIISFFFPISLSLNRAYLSTFGAELIMNTLLCPFLFKFLGIFKNLIFLDPEKVS
ncbi:rod shape-determining protein MreD [Treponema zioleckii]|uniref:rod shape-determining protein MreD n=1 Tax=Treponema zioleckii TaxID=331680 RepID=UPI00168A666A|nr:rod shape-determining protein MreD [Treponema zioleckii]